MYICPIQNCKKEFTTKQQLGGHLCAHKRWKQEIVQKEETISVDFFFDKESEKYRCPDCFSLFSRKGIKSHIWRKHGKGVLHNPNRNFIEGKRIAWNKGLTKETDERVKKFGETLSKRVKSGEVIYPKQFFSKERREQMSKEKTLNNKGGRCKWFTFLKSSGEEVKVQGTWELKFCEVLEFLDPLWFKIGIGNQEFTYIWLNENGEKKRYTPDFYCPTINKIFEVKGFLRKEDKEKMERVLEQNNIPSFEVVFGKELKEYCESYNIDHSSIQL